MAERTKWTEKSRECYINAMVSEIETGVFVDSGFKKASWKKTVADLNESYEGAREENEPTFTYTKQQCQSYYSKIKNQWTVYNTLMNNSGFGIDPDTGGPTACDSVWNAHITVHKDAANYRFKVLLQHDECTYIFTGQGATCKYAKSSVVLMTPDIPVKVEIKHNSESKWTHDDPLDLIDEDISRTQSSKKRSSAFEDCDSSLDSEISKVRK